MSSLNALQRLHSQCAELPQGTTHAGIAQIDGIGASIVALVPGMMPQVYIPSTKTWHDFDPSPSREKPGLILPNGKPN